MSEIGARSGFFFNITQHLNILSNVLHGKRMLATEYYESIRAFKLKLTLRQTQLGDGDISHFTFLKARHATEHDAGLNQYNDEIMELLQKIRKEISGFQTTGTRIYLYHFSVYFQCY